MACAAALASLDLFDRNDLVHAVEQNSERLSELLRALAGLPHVGDVRQKGFMVGVELVRNRQTREAFDPKRRIGAAVCARLRKHGVLLRPLGDVVVLMPPLAMGLEDLEKIVTAIREEVGALRPDGTFRD